jgi:hypothetical protein
MRMGAKRGRERGREGGGGGARDCRHCTDVRRRRRRGKEGRQKKKVALEEPKNRPREGGTSERERETILSIERETTRRETTSPAQV